MMIGKKQQSDPSKWIIRGDGVIAKFTPVGEQETLDNIKTIGSKKGSDIYTLIVVNKGDSDEIKDISIGDEIFAFEAMGFEFSTTDDKSYLYLDSRAIKWIIKKS